MTTLGARSSPLMILTRDSSGPAAAQVLEIVRAGGTMTRDEIATVGDLSAATVRRVVTSLLMAGVLAERLDATREGAVGRPGARLEVAPENHVVIGISASPTVATVALGDLAGRVVGRVTARRTPGAPLDLELFSKVAARLLGRVGRRAPIAVGLVAPWGEVGVDADAAAAEMEELTGLVVRTSDPVGAAAAADHFQRRNDLDGHTLYVHAAETIGWAMVSNRVTRTEYFRGCALAHFPAGGAVECECGRRGCLEAIAAEDHFAERLHAQGLVAESTREAVVEASGNPDVLLALRARATTLGRTAAAIRDMSAPSRVILSGSALTGWPDTVDDVLAELRAAEPLGRVPVEFARHGTGEAQAACTVAVGPLYEDPLELTQHLGAAPTHLRAVRGA